MEPTASPGSQGSGNKHIRYFALIAFFVMLYLMSYLGYDLKAQPQQPARRWHPTRVPSGSNFIGDQGCLECHKERVIAQRKSSMGMAMESVAESLIFTAHPLMTFKNGVYKYEIVRRNKESFYSVSDGKEAITLPILFALGQGKAGQTYVLQYENEFYESLVSYYNEIKGLDFTIGAPRNVPASLKEALGRRLSKNDTMKCFNCHATGAVSGGQLQLKKMATGIRCEACHGPGGAHAAAGKAGEPNAGLIFNPARLSGDELSQDFCAACHRGNEEFSLLRSLEINNVRFQPYRIFKSKCYSDDRRISCTACHNPHEALNETAAYYDAKCLSCHQAKGARGAGGDAPSCRVGAKNCSSCHMPKIEPPGAHFKFTDHYIRIVKSNQAYPN